MVSAGTEGTNGKDEEWQTLKAEGNTAFAAGKYEKAIELYTRAIDNHSSTMDKRNLAICLTNRAQCEIKLEQYGLAAADSSAALQKDPTYVKAYYRRAVSNTAMLHHKAALVDLKVLSKLHQADMSLKAKLDECQKLVRRLDFEKAIEMDDTQSAAEGIDVEAMNLPKTYDGPQIGSEGIDEKFVKDMVEYFKSGKLLPLKIVYTIILKATEIFKKEASVVEFDVPTDTKLTICGDTHGQFYDLLNIFNRNGWPSKTHAYLFNGDFVDRGSWSCEIALLLLAYKCVFPETLHINRGNHETDEMNKVYGFEGECKHKYNDRTFKLFSESFSMLPLGTLIGGKFFVLHGGLFSNDNVTMDDLRKLDRFTKRQPGNEGLMMEMLWTDPQPQDGRGPSKRGVGLQFGPDVTKRFCEANGLEAVIRSHEVRDEGYDIEHDGKLITVFSAPNYCDSQGNKGAYINVGHDMKLNFVKFEAVPHPNVPPMAYASNLLMR